MPEKTETVYKEQLEKVNEFPSPKVQSSDGVFSLITPQLTMMAFPITGRIEVLWLVLFQTTLAYYVVLRLPKGLPRLVGLLPLLPPSLLVPWRATSSLERCAYSFLFHWMICTKLLMLAWDTGPAADPYSLSSFPRFFFAITSAVHLKREPQVPNRRKHDAVKDGSRAEGKDDREGNSEWESSVGLTGDEVGRTGGSKSGTGTDGLSEGIVRRKMATDENGKLHDQGSELQAEDPVRGNPEGGDISSSWQILVTSQAPWFVLLRSVFYFTVACSLARIVVQWRHLMTEYEQVLPLAFCLYFSCLFLFEGAAAIAGCLLGVELQPQFNMPFLADSVADFWGRRWNLLVSNLLRVSVYEPVLRLLNGGTKPTPWERAVSTAATFLVSGLAHEVITFYGSRTRPSGEMTAFFVLHGVAIIVEGLVLKPRGPCQLPRLLRWAYTMSFVYFTGCWLFFAPLFRTGVVDANLEDSLRLVKWILGIIFFWR